MEKNDTVPSGDMPPQEPNRVCKKCGDEHPLTEEYWYPTSWINKDGTSGSGFEYQCLDCRRINNRDYQRDWMNNHKERIAVNKKKHRKKVVAAIHAYKSRRGCIDCGENNPKLLTFHHVDPSTKSFDISSMISSVSAGRLEEEIEKCHVLCYLCHKSQHERDRALRA